MHERSAGRGGLRAARLTSGPRLRRGAEGAVPAGGQARAARTRAGGDRASEPRRPPEAGSGARPWRPAAAGCRVPVPLEWAGPRSRRRRARAPRRCGRGRPDAWARAACSGPREPGAHARGSGARGPVPRERATVWGDAGAGATLMARRRVVPGRSQGLRPGYGARREPGRARGSQRGPGTRCRCRSNKHGPGPGPLPGRRGRRGRGRGTPTHGAARSTQGVVRRGRRKAWCGAVVAKRGRGRRGRRAHACYFFVLPDPESSLDSTAMNASCGTSTLPTIFIRFLPSFCFSSSFRLREMSPP